MVREIPKTSYGDIAPASAAQQGLWFLQQLVPTNSAYNMSLVLRFGGNLDIVALKRALTEIVRRHEVLRTTFELRGSDLQQVIHSENSLGALSEHEFVSEVQTQQVLENSVHRPFDLATEPPFRVLLIRVSGAESILALTLHHIVTDRWSQGLLAQELSDLYASFADGQESHLEPLQIQYADYAFWQRGQIADGAFANQLAYWKRHLAEAPEPTRIPVDYRQLKGAAGRSGCETFNLPSDLHERLKALAVREHATLFIVLLAGFQVLLARYSGQQDIILGTHVAGRSSRDLEKLIGLLAGTLVVRTPVRSSLSFREQLQRTRQTAFDAYANQDVPFAKVVEVLRPNRNLEGMPFFSVMFGMQNLPHKSWRFPGLKVTRESIEPSNVRFDLDVLITQRHRELTGTVFYNTDLYESATIQRVLRHYHSLLTEVVVDSERPLFDIPLPEGERRLLDVWNATDNSPTEACVDRLFETQVNRTPDDIALVCEADSLTFRVLNERCNALAHQLKLCNVGPETPIATCISRSLDMVIGMLAVLKAGGVYVPLDPDQPTERLLLLLNDCDAKVLLTESRLQERLSQYTGRVIVVDKANLEERVSCPASGVTLQNAAYILYTSGSSGRPKGVVVSHRNLCTFFDGIAPWVDDPYSSRTWLAATTVSFDIAILELLWTLCHGYQVIVFSSADDSGKNPHSRLLDKIDRCNVSHFQCTPSLLSILVERPESRALASLSKLIVGGESLPVSLAKRLLGLCGDLVNVYGPTEATIWSTAARVVEVGHAVSIGRPIGNIQTFILDEWLMPVPIGAPGELFIGGEGVARGYLQRPVLTAQNFLPNPFSRVPGALMYRTGDRARYRTDGSIEFLGRIDLQVKIRGHRTELEEIESVLKDHPEVRDAVVTAFTDDNDALTLQALVIPDFSNSDPTELTRLASSYSDGWESVWDEIYQDRRSPRMAFDTRGWNSALTADPIPDQEMKDWAEETASRILEYHPRSILEIGCGLGLLLSKLAPVCDEYVGTDFSIHAIALLKERILDEKLAQVTLLHCTAEDFSRIEGSRFDMVVLNSVAQYFPSCDHLIKVLETAIGRVRKGGYVFLGDIRNLELLEAFHASVELGQAEDEVSIPEFRAAVTRRVTEERELVVAPKFFSVLSRVLPRVGAVSAELKRGRYTNELTQFRYDVVLHLDTAESEAPTRVIDWGEGVAIPEAIVARVREGPEFTWKVVGVPNLRVSREQKLCRLLSEGTGLTVNKTRQFLNSLEGFSPQQFWDLESQLGRKVSVCWSEKSAFCFDVEIAALGERAIPRSIQRADRGLSTSQLVNDPLSAVRSGEVFKRIKNFLSERLPTQMIPSRFAMSAAFPLMANGKVDRRKLGSLKHNWIGTGQKRDAPNTPTETKLAGIWEEVLHVQKIGIHANFFELGGHSLVAMQILNGVLRIFDVEISLRQLLENPTIEGISKLIDSTSPRTPSSESVLEVSTTHRSLPSLGQDDRLQRELWDEIRGLGSQQVPLAFGLSLEGRLDAESLKKAVSEIVSRHEVLRMGFNPVASLGQLGMNGWKAIVQFFRASPIRPSLRLQTTIVPISTFQISSFDLADTSVEEREGEVRRITEMLIAPFDYASPPLVRVALLRETENKHLLLVGLSHLIFDGWSMFIFRRELQQLYESFTRGVPSNLSPLPIQYADFSAWQRRRLNTGLLSGCVAHWEREYLDFHPLYPTDLPLARKGFRSANRARNTILKLDPLLVKRLGDLSRKHQISIYGIFLAGVAVVLYNYCSKEDISVGAYFVNRSHPDTESLIGWFASYQILRVHVSGSATVSELLSQIRRRLLDATTYGELSMPILQRLIPKGGHQNLREPLVTCQMVTELGTESYLDLSVKKFALPLEGSSVPLTLTLFESRKKGLTLSAFYDLEVFELASMQSLLSEVARSLDRLTVASETNPELGKSVLSFQGDVG